MKIGREIEQCNVLRVFTPGIKMSLPKSRFDVPLNFQLLVSVAMWKTKTMSYLSSCLAPQPTMLLGFSAL